MTDRPQLILRPKGTHSYAFFVAAPSFTHSSFDIATPE